MPDLSQEAVHEFWKNYDDPYLYRVICFMESVEHWTYDGNPEIEAAIKQLGDALDNITKFELQQEEYYIKIFAHLRTGRLLRVLQAIDTTHPGAASKVLMYAEENSSKDKIIEFFLRRNIAFERLRLLARVFSAERLKILNKSIEGEES